MIGRRRRAGTQKGPSPRRGVHRTRSTGTSSRSGHTGARATRLERRRLAGTRRSLIKRLTRTGRRRTQRHAGAGRRRRPWTGQSRTGAQTRCQIGPRRHYGTYGRLPRQLLTGDRLTCGRTRRWRTRLSRSGCGARRRRNRNSRPDGRRRRRCSRGRRQRTRRWHRRSARQRLARARKNLTGAGSARRDRPRGRRKGPQRRKRRQWSRRRMRWGSRWTGRRSSGALPHRRMNWRPTAQHGRAQRNCARLVFSRSLRLLLVGCRRSRSSGRCALCVGLCGSCGRRTRGRRDWHPALRRLDRPRLAGSPGLDRGSGVGRRGRFRRPRGLRRLDDGCIATKIAPQFLRVVVVDRTGMGQRLGNTELVKFIDDLTRLNLELPRQLIDSDLTHV
jgi:hypothetical protein